MPQRSSTPAEKFSISMSDCSTIARMAASASGRFMSSDTSRFERFHT